MTRWQQEFNRRNQDIADRYLSGERGFHADYGITKQRMWAILKRMGVPRDKPGNPREDITPKLVDELSVSLTAAEVAEKLQCSMSTVYDRIKAAELTADAGKEV